MMALRRPQVDPAERLVRVADVLAELAEQNPSRLFDEQAERVAKGLRPAIVERDWSGRAVIPAMDAERLLLQMKRDQAERERQRGALVEAAEREYHTRMPPGVVGVVAPGQPDWYAPGVNPRVLRGGKAITDMPGSPR